MYTLERAKGRRALASRVCLINILVWIISTPPPLRTQQLARKVLQYLYIQQTQ